MWRAAGAALPSYATIAIPIPHSLPMPVWRLPHLPMVHCSMLACLQQPLYSIHLPTVLAVLTARNIHTLPTHCPLPPYTRAPHIAPRAHARARPPPRPHPASFYLLSGLTACLCSLLIHQCVPAHPERGREEREERRRGLPTAPDARLPLTCLCQEGGRMLPAHLVPGPAGSA